MKNNINGIFSSFCIQYTHHAFVIYNKIVINNKFTLQKKTKR